MNRLPLPMRILFIVLALGVFKLLVHLYGTHPVELLISIPAEIDDGKSGVDLRIVNPQGKLIVRLEQNLRAPAGHTIVIATRLPRGKLHIDGWLTQSHQRVGADLTFDEEDSLEVPLQPR